MPDTIHSDETAAPVAPPKRSLANVTLIIITCFLAPFLNVLAITSCNIALPDIGRALHLQQGSLQWIPSSFALSAGCFLLLSGRLADLYGRKLVFLVGTAWMGVFSLGCGFAQTTNQLLVLRGLQGIGSAANMTAAIGILAQSFPPGRTRSMGFAAFSGGAPTGGAFGFVFGAIITQLSAITWRGVFHLNVGLAALTFVIAFFAIDPDQPSTESDKRVDWVGAALVTAGLVLVTFVLGQGELAPHGWRTPYIIALLIVGVFLVVAFVFWEIYLDKHCTFPPLVRLGIFARARGKFAAIQVIIFFQFCSFMSWMLYIQLYYQSYKGYTPIQTMIRLLPMNVTGLSLNFIVGFVVGWLPALYLLVAGTIATGVACLLFAIINVNTTYWAYAFPSTVLTVWGTDFIFACGSLFVSRVALPHEQSVAGGIFSTFAQLGTSFGLAITTTVSNAVTTKETSRLGIVPNAEGTNIPLSALLKGYRAAQWTGFAFAMGALVLSALLFRGVGIIGGKEELKTERSKSHDEAKTPEDNTSVASEKAKIDEP